MKVYLINQSFTNLYKIGITKKNPLERLKELKIGNANDLVLIVDFVTKHSFKLERALHAYYSQYRISSEWFELNEIDDFIDVCERLERNLDILKSNPFYHKI